MTTEITTTETTTTVDFEALVATANAARATAEQAQLAYEQALRDVAAVKPTFTVDGQVYQIRHRVDSKLGRPLTYLCELRAEPKTWLGGKRGPRVTSTASTSAPEAAATMQHVADGVAAQAEASETTVVID